jgi:RNA recognition motif-containing protein
MNIYVGNLSRAVTETELKEAFQTFGEISRASVVKDQYSGESRGFGFVEMPNKDEAQKAIGQAAVSAAAATGATDPNDLAHRP